MWQADDTVSHVPTDAEFAKDASHYCFEKYYFSSYRMNADTGEMPVPVSLERRFASTGAPASPVAFLVMIDIVLTGWVCQSGSGERDAAAWVRIREVESVSTV
jgi:hypothetical protein